MTPATPHRSRRPAIAFQQSSIGPHEIRPALRGRVPVPLERLASARLQRPASGAAHRITPFSRHDMQVAVTIPL